MGHSDSDSDSEHGKKHDKHSKHDKKEKKHEGDHERKHKDESHGKHRDESSYSEYDGGHGGGHGGGGVGHGGMVMPGQHYGGGHENVPYEGHYGKFKKEDVVNLKNRTDISDEEREHRRKTLMAEVAAGVVGAGALGVAGYAAYQHFNKDGNEKKGVPVEGHPVEGHPEGKTSWFK